MLKQEAREIWRPGMYFPCTNPPSCKELTFHKVSVSPSETVKPMTQPCGDNQSFIITTPRSKLSMKEPVGTHQRHVLNHRRYYAEKETMAPGWRAGKPYCRWSTQLDLQPLESLLPTTDTQQRTRTHVCLVLQTPGCRHADRFNVSSGRPVDSTWVDTSASQVNPAPLGKWSSQRENI